MEHKSLSVVISRSSYNPDEEESYCGFLLAKTNNCCNHGLSSKNLSYPDNEQCEWTRNLGIHISKYCPHKVVEAKSHSRRVREKRIFVDPTTNASPFEPGSIFQHKISPPLVRGNPSGDLQKSNFHRELPRAICSTKRHRSVWLPAIPLLQKYFKA